MNNDPNRPWYPDQASAEGQRIAGMSQQTYNMPMTNMQAFMQRQRAAAGMGGTGNTVDATRATTTPQQQPQSLYMSSIPVPASIHRRFVNNPIPSDSVMYRAASGSTAPMSYFLPASSIAATASRNSMGGGMPALMRTPMSSYPASMRMSVQGLANQSLLNNRTYQQALRAASYGDYSVANPTGGADHGVLSSQQHPQLGAGGLAARNNIVTAARAAARTGGVPMTMNNRVLQHQQPMVVLPAPRGSIGGGGTGGLGMHSMFGGAMPSFVQNEHHRAFASMHNNRDFPGSAAVMMPSSAAGSNTGNDLLLSNHTRMIQDDDDRFWMNQFNQLKQFREDFGHCHVPA